MLWIILVHFVLAAVIVAARQVIGRSAFLVGALGPASTLIWAISRTGPVLDGDPYDQELSWVPDLDLMITLRIDAYGLLFLYVIGAAGIGIFAYAARYFGSTRRVAVFAANMTAFAGAMVGLVSSDHLLALFLFWELTTITSYLLIGYDDHKPEARSAALHAAIVTGAGGLALLGGLVLLGNQSGTLLISEIVADPPAASTQVSLAWALVLVGAVTKSAQFPFHAWLPGAMAAPTPASAFLHSATMVKAGIFLVGRLAPAAVAATTWWRPTVIAIGLATMAIGGWRALRQTDLKVLLAFGTVSQLGFLFLLFGAGGPKLLFGGVALLAAHALFKAALFLVVGTIDHEAGTRDLRRLSGLRSSMPVVVWVGVAAAASMAAVPLTYGFAAKEAAFDALVAEGVPLIAATAALSIITVVYTGRFVLGILGPAHEGHEPAGASAHTPRDALLWSPLVLAGAGLVLGLAPGLVKPLVKAAAVAVVGAEVDAKLVAWPGLVTALAWSLASLTIGLVLLARPAVLEWAIDGLRHVSRHVPEAEATFHRSIAGLLRLADRSSSLIQNGSLPFYLAVITLVAAVLPSTALVGALGRIGRPPVGGPLEMVLGLVVVASAVALVVIRGRFAAVILLGGVGYGLAGFYALLGGPDLSVTQLLVETLAIALFALVLRHMPAPFPQLEVGQVSRAVVAVAMAGFVFVGGLVMSVARVAEPASDRQLALSVPEADGANVVNVILVDFRALDTLGEITVLATAALGASGLVLPIIRRRREAL